MTNEEAKSELMQIYGMLSEEKKQALDVLMAQADGEYIRRSDVIKAVDKHTIDTSEIVLDEDITVILEELPSVAIPSAEPKTGRWIEKDGFDGDVYYDCSECGESWTTIEGTPWDNEWNYCPNCGARMVEPQERSK